MNLKEEIKRRIEVQQAWLDGETIECLHCLKRPCSWRRIGSPEFDWKIFDYRVKTKVYVKPEDLEVGKTYLDESNELIVDGIGGKITILCKDGFHFGVRVVTIKGTCPRRCFVNTRRIGFLKLLEVQEDGQ